METMTNETKVAVIPAPGPEQENALTQEVTGIERQAEAFIVETDADYKLACEFGRALKQKTAEVKAFFKPMKDSAHQAHKAVCDRETAMLKPLTNAERIIKQSCGVFLQEKERKRREAEEAARRAIEAERERALKEATEAEAAGDTDTAEERFNDAVIMDSATAYAMSSPEKPKIAGTSVSKDWEIKSIDQSAVPVEFGGMVIRPVDEAALKRLIRASRGTIKIPGVVYQEKVNIGFRR